MKRSSPKRSCLLPLLLLLFLLTSGCQYGESLLGEAERIVDPRRPFPGFAEEAEAWGFPLCDGWQGSGAQTVHLGDLFTAQLPAGRGWTGRIETSGATLLVRYERSLPAAFVYAERIQPEVSGGLGMALRGFLRRVDHRWPRPTPTADEEAAEAATTTESSARVQESPAEPGPTASRDEDPAAPAGEAQPPEPSPQSAAGAAVAAQQDNPDPSFGLEGLTTAAEELGEAVSETVQDLAAVALTPGYASEDGTFSGWRWIGQCREPAEGSTADVADAAKSADTSVRPFLRLARTEGRWRVQTSAEPLPAFMVLATVTLPDRLSYGVHLAIVCTEAPQCEAAPDLARLLGSLRLSAGATVAAPRGTWGSDDFQILAKEVGVSLPGGTKKSG